MKRYLLSLILAMLCLNCVLWSQTLAERLNVSASNDSLQLSAVVQDSLIYAADSTYYDHRGEMIYLFGNTSINYDDSSITADSLRLDLDQDKAYSHGTTILQDGSQILIGSNVRFDLETQEGIIDGGISQIEKAYYSGDEIRKTGRDIYDVDDAHFTTCDDPDPCFYFTARQMRVYRGDKVVGKPVIAYVNDFPVFYFPFITIPIRRGRHPGFLIPEPGYNNFDGKFIKNIAWYYPYKDYADLTVSFDLREKTGWNLGLESIYTNRYKFSGKLDATYRHHIDGNLTNRDWAIRANHHHELGERSTLDANIDFVTNKRIWESSDDLDENLAQTLSSSVSYRKPLLNSYLNIGSTYTQDLINDRVYVSLPSASFSLPSRPLYELFYRPERSPDAWWSNLTWNYSVRLSHNGVVNKADPTLEDIIWSNSFDPADSTIILTQHNLGINHRMGLSYNWKLKGWLNFRQGVDYNESWYDRDRSDKSWVRGNNYSAYMNSNFNIYGTRNFPQSYIRSVRHIISPSVGISYNPDFSDNARFFNFGGISLSSGEEAANLSFGIDQKWQIKYGRGEESQLKKLTDVFSWSSRINANLLKDKKFSNLTHSLYFRPGTFNLGDLSVGSEDNKLKNLRLGYSASYSLNQNPYEMHLDDWALRNHYFSHNIALSGTAPYTDYFPRKKNKLFDAYLAADSTVVESSELLASEATDAWNLTLAHDFYGAKSPFDPSSHNLRLNASLNISKNWSLSYNNYYNIESGDMISQSFSISRDLHCWKLDISYTRRNDYWSYRIVLFNTTLPEALRFQNRDSGRI